MILFLPESYIITNAPVCVCVCVFVGIHVHMHNYIYVTRFGIMSRKSPKVELRYGPRKSE